MRIFLILSPSGNMSVPGSMTWYYNLYEPLKDLGHDVCFIRKDRLSDSIKTKTGTQDYKNKMGQKLFEIFKLEHSKKPFDFFLSYFTDSDVDKDLICEIKKTGVPTANFSCNNTHQFYLTKNIAPFFDYNLHSEKSAKEKFKKIGANPVWFQMAANPKHYYPFETKKIHDVSFIGACYARRATYVGHLLENNINMHCYGPNWLINKPYPGLKYIYKEYKRYMNILKSTLVPSEKNRFKYTARVYKYDFLVYLRNKYKDFLHYPVSDLQMIKLYSQSKINLGFLEVYRDESNPGVSVMQHLHLREFEIPMSGGLYVTNYSEELAEFYEPDKEVVTFRNEHELLDKIVYFLNNEDKAEIVRKAGYKRALECHTYHRRFDTLFKELKLA